MTLTLIEGPQNPAVSLEEVKRHLRIRQANTAQDVDLTRIAVGCVNELDGPDGVLGRALITQRWSLWLDCFPPVMEMPLPPLQAITCLKFMDASGAWAHLASSEYRVTGIGGSAKAEISPAPGKSWPAVYPTRQCIEIRFRCGYGDNEGAIPGALKSAILEMIGIRSSIRDGTVDRETRTFPVDEMPGLQVLDQYRVWL